MGGRSVTRRVHPLLPNLRWRTGWLSGRTRLSAPPYYVNIEPTNLCNLRCTLCSMDGSRPGGFMDEALFGRIVDDAAAAGVTEARLFLGGEPLLHPGIAGFVRRAEEAGLITCIHTNAVRLDAGMSASLLDAGLSQISFSFDGDSAVEYEQVRVGARFDLVLANILGFLETKRERGMSLPETTLQMILPEAARVRRGGAQGGPRGKRSPNAPPEVDPGFAARFEGLPLDRWLILSPHNWAGERQDIDERRGSVFFPCQALWQSLSIGWDGTVFLCCGDLNGRVRLGDLRTQTLMEVWNGPPMVETRRWHVRRETSRCPLCSSCGATWRNHHPLASELWKLFRGRLV